MWTLEPLEPTPGGDAAIEPFSELMEAKSSQRGRGEIRHDQVGKVILKGEGERGRLSGQRRFGGTARKVSKTLWFTALLRSCSDRP